MTSSVSFHTQLTPDDRDAFVAAVTAVCEESFYAFAEPAGRDVMDRAAHDDTWFEVTVDFSGPFAGALYVALPSALGRELCASFLGCDPGEPQPDDAIEDLVGELGNMACGCWLTALGESQCFSLDHPIVQTTDDPALIGATLVAVNDQPLAIGIRQPLRAA